MHVRLKRPPRERSKVEIVGETRYHRDLASSRLKHQRDILVWLPPSYSHDSRKRFPVLYMQDGQNLMDPATAFLGRDWHIDEIVTNLIRRDRVREIIIVGVYNTPDRLKEYSGFKMGRDYGRFMAKELKPFIDATYRTQPHNTAVMGSSMGGLISFYLAWWYPELFPQVACMSSSFFWNQNRAIRDVQDCEDEKKHISIYLDVGEKEHHLIPSYEKMVTALLEKGYQKGFDLEYHTAKDGDHSEPAWSRRLWRPLKFLFGKSKHVPY